MPIAEIIAASTAAVIAGIAALIEMAHMYFQYHSHEDNAGTKHNFFAPVLKSSCCNIDVQSDSESQ
jgi:hypothetical protein